MQFLLNSPDNRFKFLSLSASVLATVIVTYVGIDIFDMDIAFPHLFYIPILLATMWWGIEGIYLALFLGGFLVINHLMFHPDRALVHDVFRATMFFGASSAIWLFRRQTRLYTRDTLALRQKQNETGDDLIESRKRYELLFNSTKDAIFIHSMEQDDLKGTFIEVNDAACHMLGYTEKELLLLSPADLVPLEEHPYFPSFRKALFSKRHVLFETKNIKKNRESISVECRIYLFEHNSKPAALCLIRNISKRKQLEKELADYRVKLEQMVQQRTSELIDTNARLQMEIQKQQDTDRCLQKSEYHYRTVVNDLPALVCRFYPDTTITFINGLYCSYFNRTENELIGHQFFDFVPEHEQENIRKHLASFTPRQPVINHDNEIILSDGQLRWQHWIDRAFFDAQGNVTEFQSIGMDITERKQAEIERQESEATLQAIFDGILEPLILMDTDLSIKQLNKAATTYCRKYGKSTEPGASCFEVIHNRNTPCKGCRIPSIIQSGEKQAVEQKNPFDPDIIERVVIYPVHSEKNSAISGFIIRIADITERKKIDRQLMRKDRLSSLGQLAAGIAHEIRNPLSGISLFVDILSDPNKFSISDQQIDCLEEIKENINRISVIIKQVLNFANPPVTFKKTVDVNTVIHQTLKLWRTQLRKSGITLTLQLNPEIPKLSGDMIQLQQVFHNLVSNAAEAMETGGSLVISTRAATCSIDRSKPVLRITVTDTGCGISQKDAENIFNPFFTTKPAGTGLGLSITHSIIKNHDGVILAESEPGKGTTFTIELPAEHASTCS